MTIAYEAGCRTARALWYTAPGTCALISEPLAPVPPGSALVRTLWSAVSRGTERLVLDGLNDPIHASRMRAPMQEGDFPFPVKYGYCAVGRVEEGPEGLVGCTVFALAPHQDLFIAPVEALLPVPDGIPPRRAALAANMETALNAVWDAGAGPGDRIVVVGAGLVGLLVAFLCAGLPGTEVRVIDPAPRPAAALGFRQAADGDAIADADIVFHTSGTPQGLATALACCGEEARLVEMSWYGDRLVEAPLGGVFHHRRLQILSSQVGAVSPSRRPRWDHRRRLAKALSLTADPRLDVLFTNEVAFAELPGRLPDILAPFAEGVSTLVRYDREA